MPPKKRSNVAQVQQEKERSAEGRMELRAKRQPKRETNFFYKVKAQKLDYEPFICPECNYPYKYLGNLKEHIKSFHLNDNFTCHICNKAVKGEEEFRKHLRDHYVGTIKCEYCEQILDNIPYDFHLAQCVRRPLFDFEKVPIVSTGDKTKENFQLNGAFKVLASHSEITNLCWITPESDVSCSKCFAKFSSKVQLANHNCGATIKNPNYNSSQKNVASIPFQGNTPSKVSTGQNKFSSPHLLCQFINSQSPASNESSLCPLCKSDIPQSNIVSHLLENHEMSLENVVCVYTALNKKFDRVVLCRWCRREFKKSSSCTAHSRCCYRKPGYYDGKCNHCDKEFESIGKFQVHSCFREYKIENAQCKRCKILLNNLLAFDFKNHEDVCQQQVSNETINKPPIIPHPVRRGRRPKPFHCSKCKKRFEEQKMLDKHSLQCCPVPVFNTMVDFGEMKYCCDNCGQCFPTQAVLSSHTCDVLENITFDNSMDADCHKEEIILDPFDNSEIDEKPDINVLNASMNQSESMETEEIISSDCGPVEDSSLKYNIVDFNYMEVDTFDAFMPINLSHFICAICYTNLSDINILGQHLVSEHNVKLPPVLKVGRMKSTYAASENESIF